MPDIFCCCSKLKRKGNEDGRMEGDNATNMIKERKNGVRKKKWKKTFPSVFQWAISTVLFTLVTSSKLTHFHLTLSG
jgi:hypothetical protein